MRRGVVAARVAYAVLALLLVASVVAQVALAGLAVMSDASWWEWHRSFVHAFENAPLLLLVAAAVGRARAKLLWLSALPLLPSASNTRSSGRGLRPSRRSTS